MAGKKIDRKRRRKMWLGLLVLLILLAAAAAWKWTPLADHIELRKVTAWALSLRHNPARVPIILGAYALGSLISFPITLLIVATALVFGPAWGSVYSFIGCILGSVLTYAVGYFLGRDFIRQMIGAKWKRVESRINQTGVIAVATLRLLPVAPFTIVNIISGAFQVPLRDYIVGSLLGLAPGILVINLFAHQVERAMRNPGIGTFALLAVFVVITALGGFWLQRKLSGGAALSAR